MNSTPPPPDSPEVPEPPRPDAAATPPADEPLLPEEDLASPPAEGPSPIPPEEEGREMVPHRGPMILVFGILSVVTTTACCLFPPCALLAPACGLLASIFGYQDLQRIRRGEMDPTGHPLTVAGFICGVVGVAIGVLSIVPFVISIILGNVNFKFNWP